MCRWALGNEPARHRSRALDTDPGYWGSAAYGVNQWFPHRMTGILILASQDCHEDAVRGCM